jgi:hypothetical protein
MMRQCRTNITNSPSQDPESSYWMGNWWEYDAALRDRGSLTVWVTPEAIATWHLAKTRRPGRSAHYSDIVIETGLCLGVEKGPRWRGDWRPKGALTHF